MLGKTRSYRQELVIQPLHAQQSEMVSIDDVVLYGFVYCLYFGAVDP